MGTQPLSFDDDQLKHELDKALGDFSAADVQTGPLPGPRGTHTDERGRIRGTIVSIRGQDVFVDIGGKSDAFVPADEFEPEQPPVVGQVHLFNSHGFDRESGLMRLSLREARTDASWDSLHVGDVVEARVTGVNLGGLELAIHGIRGFMPKSQVDVNRVENFAPFVNHRMECEVVEIDRRGKSVLLSRRRVLERQRQQQREELRSGLAEGQVRPGIVRRIAPFGAFVDIGGIDGLLHVSDMAYSRVAKPDDVLKVGQEIQVKVLKIDLVNDRISLGLKQLEPDPWDTAIGNYRAGTTVDGRITRVAEFGAFVELEPGVEGMIPVSELSWTKRVRHPRDVVAEGDSIRVQIMNVDADHHKISLSLKALGADPWTTVRERYTPDTTVSGAITRITTFGAFVQLEEGVEGLVHISELSDKHVNRVSDVVKEGQVVQARVLGVDSEQRRIGLSLRSKPSDAPPVATAGEGANAGHAVQAAAEKKRKRPLRGGLSF